MTHSRLLPVALGLALATALPVSAEPPVNHGNLTRGTSSLRAHLSERLDFRVRAPHNSGTWERFEHTQTAGPNRQSAASGKAFLDWDLDLGGLRMTGGALQVESQPDNPLAADDTLTAQRALTSDSAWRPYVGLGWDTRSGDNSRLDVQLDLGLIFQSVGSGQNNRNEPPSLLNSDALLREEFESFRSIPAFSAGIEYRF